MSPGRPLSDRAWRILLPVATGVILLGMWYVARELLGPNKKFLLPAPHTVVAAFGENRADLFTAAFNTSTRAVMGFSLAVAVSLGLALLLSWSPLVRSSLYPYLMMLQMTPVIVLAPIIMGWAGPGARSVVIVTFLICFFPMVVNNTQGLISTERTMLDLFRLYRASKQQEVMWLRLPAAMPYFFTGLRIAATLAPIGAIVGDYTVGTSGGDGGGLGYRTIEYSSRFQMGALYATAFTGCALGFLFVAFVFWLSWLSLRKWHDSFSKRDA
jgi:NitT/TauT family transport system permease protein